MMTPSKKLSLQLNALAHVATASDMAAQHAAGIIRGGKLVATACNQSRTKLGRQCCPSVHAEPAVLTRFQRQCREKWVLPV